MSEHIDLDVVDRYLDCDLSPEDCMGLSDLDGFLTGIVVGPKLIMPSAWLPVIWGNEEPEFESTAHAESIVGSIIGRYNEIAAGFDSDPERFEPIFWKGPMGEVIVADWAAGFLDAVEIRRSAWEPLLGHRKAKLLIEPILILGDDGEFDDERDVGGRWREFYTSKPNTIPLCVAGIYNFWKDQQQRKRLQPRRERRPRR